jgi:hypothetical protein
VINPAIERLTKSPNCNELRFIPRLPILLAVVLTLSTGLLAKLRPTSSMSVALQIQETFI